MGALDWNRLRQAAQEAFLPYLKREPSPTHSERNKSKERSIDWKRFRQAYIGMRAFLPYLKRDQSDSIDWERFWNAYRQAREAFLPFEGVLGVSYGPRLRKKGQEIQEIEDELTISVVVREKLPPDQVPKGQLVPPTFQGFRTDVRVPRLEPKEEGRRCTRSHIDLLMIDWGKVHRMHLEEIKKTPPAAPPNTDRVGQVFIIEDNGTLVTGVTGFKSIDWAFAYRYFRDHWRDDYDFVAMVADTVSGMPDPGTGYGVTVFNDVKGINHHNDATPNGGYDRRADFGTTGRLLGFQALRPQDPPHPPFTRYYLLHELGHQWCPYVLFKKNAGDRTYRGNLLWGDKKHWAERFDCEFSPMSYYQKNWTDHSDGTFSDHDIEDDEFAYCPLDLYLMGMFDEGEVQPFYYIDNPKYVPNLGRYTGARVDLALNNIIDAHGHRKPTAADSPRSFRQAFVVLTKQLAKGRKLAAAIDDDRKIHTTAFRKATRSRSVLDTYLYSDPYDGIYIRDNAADTGTEPSSSPSSDSPDIWVRKAKDGGETHQDPIRGQHNFIYVRVHNKGTENSGEVTVNVFRANYEGRDFRYPQDWRLDNHLGRKTIASVSAGDSAVVEIKWDQTMIPPATWQPCLLAEILPIHRDAQDPAQTNLKLRFVWQDCRIAQKTITIVAPSAPSTAS